MKPSERARPPASLPMFPSSGVFSDLDCPLSKRGLCDRPHCPYGHAAEVRDIRGAGCKSALVRSAGVQSGHASSVCGAPVSGETGETGESCFQELERINKEIETVRHEVEEEQRRLSHYQTVQADGSNAAPNSSVSNSETAGKHVERGSCGLSSCTDFLKVYSRAKKYMVDNSKPRTDLEYDPLSNFSANLCSYGSSGKEHKVRNGQGVKRERDAVPFDQVKPVTQAQLPRSPSPEPLDESNEDSILIIDIPPSPDKKRSRTQKLVDCVASKSQGTVEVKEVKAVPVLLDSLQLCRANTKEYKVTSPCASRVESNKGFNHCGVENKQYPSMLYVNKGCENLPVDWNVVDLTGCLEDQKILFQAAEREVENSPESASPPSSSDRQDHNWNNSPSNSVEIMNPLKPCNSPSKTSHFYKALAENPASPCGQHTKRALTRDQPAQNRVHNHQSPKQCVPSLVAGSQKTSSKMPGGAVSNQASSLIYQEQAEPALGRNGFQTLYPSTSVNSDLTDLAESSSEPTKQLLVKTDDEEVIIIVSSSEEEEQLNYSDVELSDSDPMEECYRIFMEANEDKGNEEEASVSDGVMEVEKPELNVTPQALPGRKRVAHEVKNTEQPVAKSRPQPQVLVPLRGPAATGFGSQSLIPSKIQQVQQRASMLTASVKGGQAFVSSTCQRKPETQTTACPPTQIPANIQPAPVQNAYMNYLSLGTAVIEVGHNLHLILPEGTFPLPVTSSSGQVTSLLTPVSQVHPSSAVGVRQTYSPPAVIPVQRYRSTAPVLIPAPTLKPSLTSASAHSSPAAYTAPQPILHAAAAKSVPTKRKVKQQYEAAKDKVPHDVRQRYVNMFTEEFLKTTANVNDAFEKAVAEERTVYNRSMNKLKYLSVAVNSLKRLKNQSAVSAKNENEVKSQRSKGNIPLNLKKFKGNDDMALYESLKDYILTEERLIESNYPVQHPEKLGSAALFADNKKGNTDPLKRICSRCGATYSVNQTGKHIRKEECTYHYGKGVENRVPGGVETRYSCCEGVMGAPGCQVFKLHVHDSLSLDGFVSTIPRHPADTSCPGVYSLACETCYTVHGLELSRVTVVNSNLQVVYDTFVSPDNEVIDYNTRFSGISEEDVKGNDTSIKDVQETLLSFISADTIMIGHGLETDLCALKLLHGTVVDTSVVFPHRLGPPHKLTLNNLTAEYLRRIIQESVCGHDTAEDAAACMELMLWKLKEDGKLKK